VIVRAAFALDEAAGDLARGVGRSLYSTVSGKNGRWLSLSLTVTAARTTVSPKVHQADPAACLAMRPVSMTRGRPAKVRSILCIIACCFVVAAANNEIARVPQHGRPRDRVLREP
jgi:type IV secretory pathway VirB2 component (pilin)